MSFWGELKRRNVIKVGTAYAIVAWLLIQIVTAVLPVFETPQWVVQTITFVIILGFPVAVVLAWAFQLTADGIVRDGESVSGPAGRGFSYGIVGVLLAAVTFVIADRFWLQSIHSDSAPSEATVLAPPVPSSSTSVGATTDTATHPRVRRSHINLGASEPMSNNFDVQFALSPDGTRLAYVISKDDVPRLYVRNLDELEGRLIQEPVEFNGRPPIFSADGQSIAYLLSSGIRTLDIDGGRPATVTQGLNPGPFSSLRWIDTGRFIGSAYIDAGLTKVFEITTTAEPSPLIDVVRNEEQRFPVLLPDGDSVLFTSVVNARASRNGRSSMNLSIGSIGTRQSRLLIENAYNARYAPTGHIVFMRSDALWAVPFDVENLSVSGPEVLLISGIQTNTTTGYASYDFAADGTLLYRPGTDLNRVVAYQLAWLDRSGREEVLPFDAADFGEPRISPDGRSVAITVSDANGSDIWIYDLENLRTRRLTFDPAPEQSPVWTPDGRRIIFWSERDGGGLFAKAADGTGQVERITSSDVTQFPYSVTQDGRNLIFSAPLENGADNVYLQVLDGSSEAHVLLDAPWDDDNVSLAPNGRWLAYETNEPGPGYGWVFVKPYPDVDSSTWPVSNREAATPRWGPDSSEIFFRTNDSDRTLHVARIDTTTGFNTVAEESLFVTSAYSPIKGMWDVAPDGQRFLFLKRGDAEVRASAETSLVMVTNWFEELARLAPAD